MEKMASKASGTSSPKHAAARHSIEVRRHHRLVRFICGIYALMVVLVLVGMCAFAPGMTYACKVDFLLTNWALTLVAICLCGLASLCIAHHFTKSDTGHGADVFIILATFILLIIHVRICRSYFFITGWDSGAMTDAAWRLASNAPLEGIQADYGAYFSRYPNNLFLLFLAEQCMKAAIALGMPSALGGVFVFSILNCISCAAAMLLVYWTLKTEASTACGIAGWIGCLLVIWTSPWMGILYSDAITVLFPAAEIALYVKARKTDGLGRYGIWMALACMAGIAYAIKPQTIFSFFAILLLEAFKLCKRLIHKVPDLMGARRWASVIGIMAGIILARAMTGAATATIPLQLDSNLSVGPAHFLMMGLNPETRGVYYQTDVEFSCAIGNKELRDKADLEVAEQRIREYGPSGLVRLFADKAMTDYNDGTFAWGFEGHFFDQIGDIHGVGKLAEITRSMYYPTGTHYELWKAYAQFTWIVQLVGGLIGAIFCLIRPQDFTDDERDLVLIISLALLMLTAFELLFEARARYLFSSATLYIMLAAIGMQMLGTKIGLRSRKNRMSASS